MTDKEEKHVYASTMPSSWSDLVELDQEGTQDQGEDIIQIERDTILMEMDSIQTEKITIQRSEKRKGDEDISEWTEVKAKEKKQKWDIDKIEVYISCSEPLPKQFGLARLFKDNDITDILRVKYVNAYKVRLDMQTEVSADRLEKCLPLLDRGWRIQRAMEKSISYGVIRDVDLDLSDEEIKNIIVCPKPAELLSIFRLNRRNSNEGWVRSEAVRLCFRGSYLPPYISVDGLRIKVDPYIFPVSQCTKCWKLGHPTKKCPSNKKFCPKCGNNHDNCDTTTFKCINCDGAHMALYKGCPAFLKEKRLRDIMAEFNCTYRKALTIYVPPSSPTDVEQDKLRRGRYDYITLRHDRSPVEVMTPSQRESTSYANILKTKAQIHNGEQIKKNSQSLTKKQVRHKESVSNRDENDCFLNPEPLDTNKPGMVTEKGEEKREREVSLSELIKRLKEILFVKNASILGKVSSMLKCCIEWLVLVVCENVSDWPIIKKTLDFFCFVNG